jgi:hypothetical protein
MFHLTTLRVAWRPMLLGKGPLLFSWWIIMLISIRSKRSPADQIPGEMSLGFSDAKSLPVIAGHITGKTWRRAASITNSYSIT